MDGQMLVRIQSPYGITRLLVSHRCTVDDLQQQIRAHFGDIESEFRLSVDKEQKKLMDVSGDRLLTDYGIRNGDMVYLHAGFAPTEMVKADVLDENVQTVDVPNVPLEDEVDLLLYKEPGLVERPKDPVMCQHGDDAKCSHCRPYDVFDPAYISKKELKYISFHAYLRQQGVRVGVYCLEKTKCTIKKDCRNHQPWPKGFCLQCQPPVITLQRQTYRHVDNISFENSEIGNRLFTLWQKTGLQRFGLLIGRYEPYTEVPLGIRAVVMAIYEPPQLDSPTGIKLLPDDMEQYVQKLCKCLGLSVVGMIFTHMFGQYKAGTQVMDHLRHSGTYLLSGQECIRSATYQNRHANACRFSSDGVFGSKFVTVVTTGDSDGSVHVSGYQASDVCADLVAADCLVPVQGHPGYVQTRKSSAQRFVPEVTYRRLDSYGNSILGSSSALPVEFLFVDIMIGVSKVEHYDFNPLPTAKPFPIENRVYANEVQNLQTMHDYVSQFGSHQMLEMASDFHFLVFLLSNAFYKFEMDEVARLCECIRKKDSQGVIDWFKTSKAWTQLQECVRREVEDGESIDDATVSGTSDSWKCPHCTYVNTGNGTDCSICSLPRSY